MLGRSRLLLLSLLTLVGHGAAQSLVPGPVPPGEPIGPGSLFAPLTEVAKLTSPSASDGDRFGGAVALWGGALFVGAPGDDTAALDAGAVFVYERVGKTWVLDQVVTPLSPMPGAAFGWSLCVDRGTLAVGAPGDFSAGTHGAVHCFEREVAGAWDEVAVIAPWTSESGARFGSAIDLDGDDLIVGSPFSAAFGSFSGNAHVFERDARGAWSETAELSSHYTLPSGGLFGMAVAVRGDLAVVGAPYIGMQFVYGTAYVFDRVAGVWQADEQVYGPLPIPRDRFGTSIAMDDTRCYVGGTRDSPPPFGLLSYFEVSAGDLVGVSAQIGPSPTLVDRFGGSVALDRGRLLVGAFNQAETGAAYLYDVTAGEPQLHATLLASDGAANDGFGQTTAVRGRTAAVGAPERDEHAVDDGAVYVYTIP